MIRYVTRTILRINSKFIYNLSRSRKVDEHMCMFCEATLSTDDQYCPECGLWLVQETTINH